jgi:hypothetical protein
VFWAYYNGFVSPTDVELATSVEILECYPRRFMGIKMDENMWSIGTVKGDGILVTLAAGNIL